MGTGVGEAMLISAVTGAGTSAVMGGDPLKGALLGAATGGVGAGVAGGASGAAGSAGAAGAAPIETASNIIAGQSPNLTAGVTDALRTGVVEGSTALTDPLAFNQMDAFRAMDASKAASVPTTIGQTGTVGLPSGAQIPSITTPSGDISSIAAYTGPGSTLPPPTATTPPTALEAFYARNPIAMPAGLGALGSFIGDRPGSNMPGAEEYSGPLNRFSYDPDKYRPRRAASGGLMDTMPAKRMAGGGLGSYSDGGQLLKGPGDGMSDDIPASIGGDQPALLADGEFVVPADVVSGLGNGSTDAGARQLYAMMEAVRKARTGTDKQAPEIDSSSVMPA